MKQLYKDASGQYVMRRSFCAYLDILGFSEKISANDLTFFNRYLNVLQAELAHIESVHDLSDKEGGKSFELKIFTDNFVFGHPWYDEYGEVELGDIFEVLSHIQLTFAKANIFVRGAVSVSNLVMDENIVLGPAIIESYKLESEKAVHPRVILSDGVVEIMKEHIGYYGGDKSAPQNTEYLIDIDGYYFVNYLYTLFYDDDPPPSFVIIELVQHRDAILQNLVKFADNFKLFDKYSWIAKYHNYFCDNFIIRRFPKIDLSKIKLNEGSYLKNIRRVI
jgi:hypothetical protein